MVALGTICPFRNFPDVPKGPTKSCFWSAESDGRDGAEAKALMIYVPRAIFIETVTTRMQFWTQLKRLTRSLNPRYQPPRHV